MGDDRGPDGDRRGWIRAGKNPVRGLAVPYECMADDLPPVAQTKVHEGVRRAEVMAVLAFLGMDQLPFHVASGRT